MVSGRGGARGCSAWLCGLRGGMGGKPQRLSHLSLVGDVRLLCLCSGERAAGCIKGPLGTVWRLLTAPSLLCGNQGQGVGHSPGLAVAHGSQGQPAGHPCSQPWECGAMGDSLLDLVLKGWMALKMKLSTLMTLAASPALQRTGLTSTLAEKSVCPPVAWASRGFSSDRLGSLGVWA